MAEVSISCFKNPSPQLMHSSMRVIWIRKQHPAEMQCWVSSCVRHHVHKCVRNVFVFETRNQVLVDFARLDKNRHSSLSSPSLHLFDSQFSDNRCNNSLICWSPSSTIVCAVLLQFACSVTLRGSVWILVNFCLHTAAVVLTWQSMLSNTTNKMQDPRKRW